MSKRIDRRLSNKKWIELQQVIRTRFFEVICSENGLVYFRGKTQDNTLNSLCCGTGGEINKTGEAGRLESAG